MQQTRTASFEQLRSLLKNSSEMNFLRAGSQQNELLTLKSYLPFLVRMRTVKGQNVNSILTESQILDNGMEIPKNAFAFYTNSGEKCYDLAFIPSNDKKLNFENSLGSNLLRSNSDLNNISITKDNFDKMSYALNKVFGVKIDLNGNRVNYKASRLRTLGRKIINVFRGKNTLHKQNGTLYLEAPNFKTKEGTPERVIEQNNYYRDSLVKYLDFVAPKINELDFNNYKDILFQSQTFNDLSVKLQLEQLEKHQNVFEDNKDIINSISNDLIISEIVKSMPSLNAKTRYELNQAYILRASQQIASLPSEVANDPIILKLVAQSIEQPILNFNKDCKFLTDAVKTMYQSLMQNSTGSNLEDIIFGDCEQKFVNEFSYNFTKPLEVEQEDNKENDLANDGEHTNNAENNVNTNKVDAIDIDVTVPDPRFTSQKSQNNVENHRQTGIRDAGDERIVIRSGNVNNNENEYQETRIRDKGDERVVNYSGQTNDKQNVEKQNEVSQEDDKENESNNNIQKNGVMEEDWSDELTEEFTGNEASESESLTPAQRRLRDAIEKANLSMEEVNRLIANNNVLISRGVVDKIFTTIKFNKNNNKESDKVSQKNKETKNKNEKDNSLNNSSQRKLDEFIKDNQEKKEEKSKKTKKESKKNNQATLDGFSEVIEEQETAPSNSLLNNKAAEDKSSDNINSKIKDVIEKGGIVKEDNNKLQGVITTQKFSKNKSFNALSQEEARQKIILYLTKRTEKALTDLSLSYEKNNKNEKKDNISSYSNVSKLYSGLNDKNTEKKATAALRNGLKREDTIKKDVLLVISLTNNVSRLADEIMEDWEDRKTIIAENGEAMDWQKITSASKFVDYWYQNINNKEIFDRYEDAKKLKTFRGAYEKMIRTSVTKTVVSYHNVESHDKIGEVENDKSLNNVKGNINKPESRIKNQEIKPPKIQANVAKNIDAKINNLESNKKLSQDPLINFTSKEDLNKQLQKYLSEQVNMVLNNLTIDNKNKEFQSSFDNVYNLFSGVNDKKREHDAHELIQSNMKRNDIIKKDTKLVLYLLNDTYGLADIIVKDWENRNKTNVEGIASEWQNQKTMTEFLNYWFKNYNGKDYIEKLKNDDENKLFKDCFNSAIKRNVEESIVSYHKNENNFEFKNVINKNTAITSLNDNTNNKKENNSSESLELKDKLVHTNNIDNITNNTNNKLKDIIPAEKLREEKVIPNRIIEHAGKSNERDLSDYGKDKDLKLEKQVQDKIKNHLIAQTKEMLQDESINLTDKRIISFLQLRISALSNEIATDLNVKDVLEAFDEAQNQFDMSELLDYWYENTNDKNKRNLDMISNSNLEKNEMKTFSNMYKNGCKKIVSDMNSMFNKNLNNDGMSMK